MTMTDFFLIVCIVLKIMADSYRTHHYENEQYNNNYVLSIIYYITCFITYPFNYPIFNIYILKTIFTKIIILI